MNCAVCGKRMKTSVYRQHCVPKYEEIFHVCECGYEEFDSSYGEKTVTIRGVEYLCGDPTTIEGSLQAWKIWFALVEAREAKNYGDIRNE